MQRNDQKFTPVSPGTNSVIVLTTRNKIIEIHSIDPFQALYCLYAHPSKKSKLKHLVDHGVSNVAFTW